MNRILTLILCAAIPATGLGSGAMMFDGVDDYANMGNVPNLGTEDFTISGWINVEDLSLNNVFIVKYQDADNRFYFTQIPGGSLIFYAEDSNIIKARADSDSGLISENKWTHIVAVGKSGVSTTIYANGVDVTSSKSYIAHTGGDILNTGSFNLGNYNDGIYMKGQIDEVLIYNRFLEASEVEAMHASSGAWYPKTGLVSRWSMDKNGISTGNPHPNGSTVKDSAGSNDGIIVDGADSSMVLTSSPVRKKRGRR